MKVQDLRILSRHFDPHIDGYVVLGRRKEDSARRYVVAWHSRHQSNKIISRKSFSDIKQARAHFGKAMSEHHDFIHHSFRHDWQDCKVYHWEEEYLEHRGAVITRKQAMALIKAVSADYGITPPTLLWRKHQTNFSDYCHAKNKIRFGHRTDLALLHEMAHAIRSQYQDEGAFHGPLFVWTAIKLYHRYLGINMNMLVTTAKDHGLLGDMNLRKISLFRGRRRYPPRASSTFR